MFAASHKSIIPLEDLAAIDEDSVMLRWTLTTAAVASRAPSNAVSAFPPVTFPPAAAAAANTESTRWAASVREPSVSPGDVKDDDALEVAAADIRGSRRDDLTAHDCFRRAAAGIVTIGWNCL